MSTINILSSCLQYTVNRHEDKKVEGLDHVRLIGQRCRMPASGWGWKELPACGVHLDLSGCSCERICLTQEEGSASHS